MLKIIILALALLAQPGEPCGRLTMTAIETGGRYGLNIQGCAADVAALGTPEELAQTFETQVQAHNHFIFLFGRRYGVTLAPIPE